MTDASAKPRSKFLKVKCPDCSNEQMIFDKASTHIVCAACGHELATPGGGRAALKAEIVEEL